MFWEKRDRGNVGVFSDVSLGYVDSSGGGWGVGGGMIGFVVCLEGGVGGSFDVLDVGCERKRIVEDEMFD